MEEKLYNKLRMQKFQRISYPGKSREESPFDSLKYSESLMESSDLAIFYVYNLEEMKRAVEIVSEDKTFLEDGLVYLIYPKNKNKLGHTPIGRDDIFPYLKVDDETGFISGFDFKFNGMVAIDENYTMVSVKKITKKKISKTSAPSGRVDDYIIYLPQIEKELKEKNEVLCEKFLALTFGKRKDWARHIFSARTEKTRYKRFIELEDFLNGN